MEANVLDGTKMLGNEYVPRVAAVGGDGSGCYYSESISIINYLLVKKVEYVQIIIYLIILIKENIFAINKEIQYMNILSQKNNKKKGTCLYFH